MSLLESLLKGLLSILPLPVTLAIAWALWDVMRPHVWFLFYPAVLLSSWIGGWRAGVLTTAASTLLISFFFVPPYSSLRIDAPEHVVPAAVFFATGIYVAVVHDRLRAAIRRGERALGTSDRANAELHRVMNERQMFEALIENASDFIGIADADGKPIYLNPAGRRMVGLASDRPVEDTEILEYYPPEHRAFASDVILEGMREAGHWQGETFFRHWQTGEAIPVSDTHFMIREPNTGRVLGMGTVTRDISDVRESQRRFELAVEGGGLGSWDWDVETGAFVFNARAATMRGFDRGEVEQRVDSWLSGVHPDDIAGVEKALEDHFHGLTEQYRSEHRVRTKAGGWMWILSVGKVFGRDARGEATRMVGVEADIDERKRAEQEQKFLAEFGAALASTIDYEETVRVIARFTVGELAEACIVETVEERGPVQRLAVAHRDPAKNALARRLQNVTLDRSRPYLGSAVIETDEPFIIREVTPAYLDSIAQTREHRRALAELEPTSLMAFPLSAGGKPVGSMVFVRSADSSYTEEDLARAEQVARHAALAVEKARLYRIARRAIQARDDVLGIVAHDLRNPLGTILMQAGLLEPSGAGSRKPGEVIERAANRMNRLIQDLLEVTRMEAGTLSVERERVSADVAVSEAVQAQEPLATSRSVVLECDIARGLPEVWADHDRLLQIFENLIGNAMKFTPAGGRITVGAAANNDDVLFWVADTGSGIAAQDLPHVFDRFWQSSRGEHRRGAGLGLQIVKGIVEAHGGCIWVESSVGRGSTFFFTIPTAKPGFRAASPMH